MKIYAMLAVASVLAQSAFASDVEVCNLNTEYGYRVTGDTVRIENDSGHVLSVAQTGMSLDGKAIKAFSANDADGAKFRAVLREVIPAAAEVSRLAHHSLLMGLSREFYSRNKDARWAPYVRGYQKAMLEQYNAAVQTSPTIVIRRGGLSAANRELATVSKRGLDIPTLQLFAPVMSDGLTAEQQRASMDASGSGEALTRSAATMCRHVRELAVLQSNVFAGTGLANAFEIAVARNY